MKNTSLVKIMSALVLVFCIICGAVTSAIYFKPLYYMDISLLDIETSSGMSEEEIRLNYDALIDYYAPFNSADLVLPTLEMSAEGEQHFEEVRVLFYAVVYSFFLLLPLAIFVILYNKKLNNTDYLLLTSKMVLILPTVLATLIALNWDKVFVKFHEIFFQNDYWIFDPKLDPVITMLPDEFFMHCALLVLALIMCGSLGSYVAYRKLK